MFLKEIVLHLLKTARDKTDGVIRMLEEYLITILLNNENNWDDVVDEILDLVEMYMK